MTTTVVGLFEQSRDAHRAVSALLDAGYSRESISLLASDASNEYSRYLNRSGDVATEAGDDVTAGEGAGFGAVVGALTGVLVGLTSLAIPGIGPVLAAGPLVGALTGGTVGAVAGAATGGLVAGLIKTGVPESEAERYASAIQEGGMLLVVEAPDDRAAFAYDIMREYGAHDGGSNRPMADASTDMQVAGQTPTLDDTQQRAAVDAELRSDGATASEPVATENQSASPTVRDANSADMGYAAASTASSDGFESFESLDGRYREHFSETFKTLGRRYDQYSPAYRYGYDLAANPRFTDADWSDVETEARRRWEEYNPTFPWDEYADAVRYAWDMTRERLRSGS
ncbi:MAG: hypothetical protein IT323_11795 [Anaerolineae bacterium]|nr:hypothetical protein [Anaerolineae bacterium]